MIESLEKEESREDKVSLREGVLEEEEQVRRINCKDAQAKVFLQREAETSL